MAQTSFLSYLALFTIVMSAVPSADSVPDTPSKSTLTDGEYHSLVCNDESDVMSTVGNYNCVCNSGATANTSLFLWILMLPLVIFRDIFL